MAVVQIAVATGAATTITATFGATTTPGNIVVAFVSSDTTVAASGFTLRGSNVANQGAYVWDLTVGTGATAYSVQPSTASMTALILVELSGVTTFDTISTATSTQSGSVRTQTSRTITTLTTAAGAGDTVLAAAELHSFGGTAPTLPTWDNGFAAVGSSGPSGTGGTDAVVFVGSKTVAASTAVGTTTPSWTTAVGDTTGWHVAYKNAATSAALPAVAAARARRFPFTHRRTAVAQVFPALVITPHPIPPQPPRLRPMPSLRRRPRVTQVFPPLVIIPHPIPPQPTRDRLVPMPWRRARVTQVYPPIVVIPHPVPPQPSRDRLIPPLLRRTRTATPPSTVVVQIVPQPVRDRLAPQPRRRAQTTQVFPPVVAVTVQALPPQTSRDRLLPPLLRRVRTANPLQPAVVVTVQALPPQSSRDRILPPLLRRARTAAPPVTVVVQLPAQPVRDRLIPPMTRRRRATQPPPAPIVIVVPFVPQPVRRRWLPPLLRRRTSGQGTWQATAPVGPTRDITLTVGLEEGRYSSALAGSRWTGLLLFKYTATLEDNVPRIIRTSLGDKAYVSGLITEVNGKDITADTLRVCLGTATAPGTYVTPDVIETITASSRRVKLLVGTGGTVQPAAGTYYLWVQATDSPEVEGVPCTNDRVIIA